MCEISKDVMSRENEMYMQQFNEAKKVQGRNHTEIEVLDYDNLENTFEDIQNV